MKLKEFNPANSAGIRTNQISISASIAAGRFTFNQAACEFLGLDDNTKVKFFQEEDYPSSWYVTIHRDGFNLKANKHSGLIVNSAKVVKSMADSFDTKENFSLLIAGQPTPHQKLTLYGLIKRAKV